jgi:hypothetical protein
MAGGPRRPLVESDEEEPVGGLVPSSSAVPETLRRPSRPERGPPRRASGGQTPPEAGIATVPIDMLLALADASAASVRACHNLVALSAENWEELPPEIGADPEYSSLRRQLVRAIAGAPPGGGETVRESWLVAASEAASEARGEVASVISEIEAWLRAGLVRRI